MPERACGFESRPPHKESGPGLLVTLLNLEAFDYDLGPGWVRTLSYIIYPAIAVALAWTARGRDVPVVQGPDMAPTVNVSLVHDELFSSSDPATWIWFAGFGGASAALLVITARAVPAALADGRAAMRVVPQT